MPASVSDAELTLLPEDVEDPASSACNSGSLLLLSPDALELAT